MGPGPGAAGDRRIAARESSMATRWPSGIDQLNRPRPSPAESTDSGCTSSVWSCTHEADPLDRRPAARAVFRRRPAEATAQGGSDRLMSPTPVLPRASHVRGTDPAKPEGLHLADFGAITTPLRCECQPRSSGAGESGVKERTRPRFGINESAAICESPVPSDRRSGRSQGRGAPPSPGRRRVEEGSRLPPPAVPPSLPARYRAGHGPVVDRAAGRLRRPQDAGSPAACRCGGVAL
jgi:hypothetical protein